MSRDIPDAFGAVVAAVVQDYAPGLDAEPIARQVLDELRRLGWRLGPPGRCPMGAGCMGRATTEAAGRPRRPTPRQSP